MNPIIERIAHSGAWLVSDIVGGYRVSRTYYFYSRAESLRLFRQEFKGA